MKMGKRLSFVLCSALVVSMFSVMGSASAEEAGKNVSTDFGTAHKAEEWRIAATPDASTLRVEGGELKFEGAQDNSYFGPQGVYDKFAITYDINTYEGNSSWAGLSFGLPKPDSFFAEKEAYLLFLNNDSIILLRNGAADTVAWADPEQRWLRGDYALAVKEEPLNVKVVYDGSKLEVYYKLQSESADLMKEPRAVFNDLPEISGYMNFTTSGTDTIQGWFSLDNLSISTDPNAVTPIQAEQPAAEPVSSPSATEPAGNEPVVVANPQTSDNSQVELYALMAAAAGVAVLLLARKKRASQ